jgi:hypothetical protein
MEKSSASSTPSVGSIGSDDSSGSELDYRCGELRMLSEDFEFLADASESTASTETESKASSVKSQGAEAAYGPPMDDDQAALAVPEGDEGLVWYALVIPDEFISKGSLISGLNKRDFDFSANKIKTSRASLPVTQTQLFSALTKIEGSKGPRYIFNGWKAKGLLVH